ncbi:MAG: IgGFc-binding protein [Deltaproteobacteria bacterium]|nr:IgGFc-binding protein [Deltaproteobacteria bacterium]
MESRWSFGTRVACAALNLAALALSACSPAATGPAPDAGCTAGATRCTNTTFERCVDGQFVTDTACPGLCDPTYGCVVCAPNSGLCDGTAAHACKPDGSGYVDDVCDGAAGEICDPQSGTCIDACAPEVLGSSYVGCDYYPTITGNLVASSYEFAIAIANTTGAPASITIDGAGLASPRTLTVDGDSVRVERLPWRADLKLCLAASQSLCLAGVQSDGALVAGGAYHVRSSVPVTIYQFNPLDYTHGPSTDYSYSNDASLLIPTNAWRRDYYVASWPHTQTNPSLLTVTAATANTHVTITTTAATEGEVFAAGVPRTLTLDAGDVVELTSRTGDLTGTHVTSDAPVGVIGGHYCAEVPTGVQYCDHLEESMLSVDALGTTYVVNAPATFGAVDGKEEVVRIIATHDDTTLLYDPPVANAPTAIAHAGEWIEIARYAGSFLVIANHKVLVAQYMEGEAAGGGQGDPSLAIAVPVEQFRTAYRFHAPTNYETNYLDVTAPNGASVMLDGTALAFKPLGGTGYQLARVTPLLSGPAHDGDHYIVSTMPFGISVYGYGQYTSFWYPGGLDLHDIPVN